MIEQLQSTHTNTHTRNASSMWRKHAEYPDELIIHTLMKPFPCCFKGISTLASILQSSAPHVSGPPFTYLHNEEASLSNYILRDLCCCFKGDSGQQNEFNKSRFLLIQIMGSDRRASSCPAWALIGSRTGEGNYNHTPHPAAPNYQNLSHINHCDFRVLL